MCPFITIVSFMLQLLTCVTDFHEFLVLGTPEELGRFMAAQTEKWREVGRRANIRVE